MLGYGLTLGTAAWLMLTIARAALAASDSGSLVDASLERGCAGGRLLYGTGGSGIEVGNVADTDGGEHTITDAGELDIVEAGGTNEAGGPNGALGGTPGSMKARLGYESAGG